MPHALSALTVACALKCYESRGRRLCWLVILARVMVVAIEYRRSRLGGGTGNHQLFVVASHSLHVRDEAVWRCCQAAKRKTLRRGGLRGALSCSTCTRPS